jgi:hypothetical protein
VADNNAIVNAIKGSSTTSSLSFAIALMDIDMSFNSDGCWIWMDGTLLGSYRSPMLAIPCVKFEILNCTVWPNDVVSSDCSYAGPTCGGISHFTNFSSLPVNTGGVRRCVVINKNGWAIQSCDSAVAGYIVEHEDISDAPLAKFFEYANGYYELLPFNSSWDDAAALASKLRAKSPSALLTGHIVRQHNCGCVNVLRSHPIRSSYCRLVCRPHSPLSTKCGQ